MRDIKFRARARNSDWWYGSSSTTKMIHATNTMPLSMFWRWVEESTLDPETVGDYTRRKDKNGKEIYEGDNLSGDRWFPAFHLPSNREKRHVEGYVYWDEGAIGWSIKAKDTEYCLFDIIEPEVIGTIFENLNNGGS